MPAHALDSLGTAIEAGAMPLLERLNIAVFCKKDGSQSLLRAFCKDACPKLRELNFPFTDFPKSADEDEDEDEQTEEVLQSFARMLEARKGLGYCAGLKQLPPSLLGYVSVDVKMRVWLATLGTLEQLVLHTGVESEESCARLASMIEGEHVLAPQLMHLEFSNAFSGDDGAASVFQAMRTKPIVFRSVQTLEVVSRHMGVNACRALGSALQKNALPQLRTLRLTGSLIGSNGFISLLRGIEHSACANTLRALQVSGCGIGVEGAKLLGLLIGRDFLPSLQELVLSVNKNLGDEGVTYLTQSLQASSKTKLNSLGLNSVGMGEAGLKSLAEAIGGGPLLECKRIYAHHNAPLRNVIPFSNALRSGGLKNRTNVTFSRSNIALEAVTVLAHSLLEHCPT